ncbi:MAG: protease-like activity factor CPAF, partial [Zetaproteobacteria bacterium]|nr:protease-like activity factor CPAF [Zetaproteobacteria bacterium]
MRKATLQVLLALSLFYSPVAAQAATEQKSAMKALLDELYIRFNDHYAPLHWKKTNYGFDLDLKRSQLTEQIDTGISVEQYHQQLKGLISATQDYHVNIHFASTGSSVLPFTLAKVGTEYVISYIDRSHLPPPRFPFSIGDKVTSLGGEPVANIVEKLYADLTVNREKTDDALRALSITMRRGTKALPLPKGPVLVIGENTLGKELSAEVIWIHESNSMEYLPVTSKPEGFTTAMSNFGFSPLQLPMDLAIASKDPAKVWNMIRHNMKRDYSFHHNLGLQKRVSAGEVPQENRLSIPQFIGDRRGFTPKLNGKIVWQSDPKGEFFAYITENINRERTGFLRLHSYVTTSGVSATQAASQLRAIMKIMNNNADVLVIDQTSNPGGSLFYLYAIASMLTDKPLQTPKERVALDSGMVWDAHRQIKGLDSLLALLNMLGVGFSEDIDGYKLDLQGLYFLREYYRFIIEQWKEGKTLTDPYHIYGTDSIIPDAEVNFTKPVLLLVNELDFSCADFFPAIMQDNSRMTLMGENTAGAGGYVLSYGLQNNLGVLGYSMTGSIAIRPNGNPIENLGVTPDIAYSLDYQDFKNGFLPYQEAIMQQV